jgi:thiosulfate sulfurtransferase
MDIPEVDPDTAASHLQAGDALFMDVRDSGSFEASHIPGAVHVGDDTIHEFLEQTDKQQKIVVYCYHGNMSLGGAAYLIEHGFEDVCSMSGGFEAWRGRHPEE